MSNDLDEMLKNPENYIPDGIYCYTRKDNILTKCPFHIMRTDLPYQENGHCLFLGMSDWEINFMYHSDLDFHQGTSHILPDSELTIDDFDKETGMFLTNGNSLLWDLCKECGY